MKLLKLLGLLNESLELPIILNLVKKYFAKDKIQQRGNNAISVVINNSNKYIFCINLYNNGYIMFGKYPKEQDGWDFPVFEYKYHYSNEQDIEKLLIKMKNEIKNNH